MNSSYGDQTPAGAGIIILTEYINYRLGKMHQPCIRIVKAGWRDNNCGAAVAGMSEGKAGNFHGMPRNFR